MSDNFSITQRCMNIEYVLQNIKIQKIKTTEKDWEEIYGDPDEDEISEYYQKIGIIHFLCEDKMYQFKMTNTIHTWKYDSYEWTVVHFVRPIEPKAKWELWDKKAEKEVIHYFKELIAWHRRKKIDKEQQ